MNSWPNSSVGQTVSVRRFKSISGQLSIAIYYIYIYVYIIYTCFVLSNSFSTYYAILNLNLKINLHERSKNAKVISRSLLNRVNSNQKLIQQIQYLQIETAAVCKMKQNQMNTCWVIAEPKLTKVDRELQRAKKFYQETNSNIHCTKNADLVTFTEEILNGKLHILCSDKDWLIMKVVRG